METQYRGETFIAFSYIMNETAKMVGEKPLTPKRAEEIRHEIENMWVNEQIKLDDFKTPMYFSDEMSEYYIHSAFEYLYGKVVN